MKAVIIDDEADARENLHNLLKKYCTDVEVVAEADSAVAGFEIISRHKPDVVFLDIQMPDGSGLELLEQLPAVRPHVIFVTAYDEYALKAIKHSALDYLLKPINILELKAAVSKVQQKLTERQEPARQKKAKKISVSTNEGVIFLEVQDIVRCQSDDAYTTFHMEGGEKIMVSRPLKEYEHLLADSSFFRVHQSHLINMEKVKKYIKTDGGAVEMADKSVVTIARSKKDEFLKVLAEYNEL